MSDISHYIIECPNCGTVNRSHEKKFLCAGCGVESWVEWPAAIPARSVEPRTISQKYENGEGK